MRPEKEIDYEKLRLDVLRNLIDERGIPCKQTKDEIIKHLRLDDEGKYVRETTYEKMEGHPLSKTLNKKDGFIVGIDMKNQKQLVEIGKMVEKKEAICVNLFCEDRVHYWSSRKLV
jgi:hypothetical protein